MVTRPTKAEQGQSGAARKVAPSRALRSARRAVLLAMGTLIACGAHACTGQLIGFRGLEGAFDDGAFERYARHAGMCFRVFGHDQVAQAVAALRFDEPYMLYGFSAGASTARRVLEHATRTGRPRPVFVLTIGAARKADVDFRRFGVAFHNYYDWTGKGNPAPGTVLDGVEHLRMQSAVNTLLGIR